MRPYFVGITEWAWWKVLCTSRFEKKKGGFGMVDSITHEAQMNKAK